MIRYAHMKHYEAKKFNLPAELAGLSEKQIEVHLKLYEGYVTHVNAITNNIASLKDSNGEQYVINELRRRLGFEFDGMRLHEYYFEQLEEGASDANTKSEFAISVSEKYGSWDNFISHIKEVAGSRGIGWVLVTYDPRNDEVHTSWVSDHELGQLAGLPVLMAIDLWEHAFMVDYVPAEKGAYIDAYLGNVNWSVVEKRFDEVA